MRLTNFLPTLNVLFMATNAYYSMARNSKFIIFSFLFIIIYYILNFYCRYNFFNFYYEYTLFHNVIMYYYEYINIHDSIDSLLKC